jgi:hypothetical protein
MINMHTLAIGALLIVLSTQSLHAQDRSRYRDFQLGGGLPSISALTGDLAGFSVGVERTSDAIALTCDRGCDWTTLAVGCGNKKTCGSTIDDFGMTGDENTARSAAFVFTVKGTKDGVALACARGCAWQTLTFGCSEKKTCASKINEYGMAKGTK